MSKVTLKVSGSRGECYFRPQDNMSIMSQARILRQHVGKVMQWSLHRAPIGFARAYDEAVSTMPKLAKDQFADYIRDLDN